MKKSGLLGIAPYLVALAIAFAPLGLGKLILRAHGNAIGTAELDAVVTRYLGRAERVVSEAIDVLRDLDRAKHHTCLEADRIAFEEAVSRSSFLRRVGLVDENGYGMCLEPPPKDKQGAVIGSAAASERQVTLVATAGPGLRPSTAVFVGWRSLGGQRLVAELSASALDIDAGPNYLRDARFVQVLIDGEQVWAKAGQPPGAAEAGGIVALRARSDILPIEVRAEASTASFYEVVRALDLTLTVGCAALAVVMIGLTMWMTWRPEKEADDEIQLALRNREFVPYYQPVMNIDSGQIEGCEMLVRWVRPDGSVISPGRFMPYAETSGHVFEMTRQLMRQSVVELGPLFRKRPDLKLSINLFAGHFDDRRIIEDIVTIYSEGPIGFDQLVFEVTERYPLRDVEKARRLIAEMHALGCRVALDDTGTGHGGLAYLQQLGIDIIKIDKMFIDAMGGDLGASTIIDVLVELANSLGMGIVAEGVEHESQIEKLREKGVTAAQGYVFAPPLPAKLFLELAGALTVSGSAVDEGRQAA